MLVNELLPEFTWRISSTGSLAKNSDIDIIYWHVNAVLSYIIINHEMMMKDFITS